MKKVEYKPDPLLSFADQRLINSRAENSPKDEEKLKQKINDRQMIIVSGENKILLIK